VVTPVAPADTDGAAAFTFAGVHGTARLPALSAVVCCALALTATVVASTSAMAAIRHPTMCSVSSFTFVMSTSCDVCCL